MKTKSSKKSPEDYKDRVEKIMKNSVKGAWTPEEDNLIIKYQ
jgi:hypothetical protein